MTSKKISEFLESVGFIKVGQKGSHAMFTHSNHTQKIVLPTNFSNKQLPLGTLNSILKVIVEGGIVSQEEVAKFLEQGQKGE